MMIMTSYSEWGAKSAESRGECSERPPVGQKGHVLLDPYSEALWSQPYLTEPFYIDRNEEYGQKRNCPPGSLFWGTVLS